MKSLFAAAALFASAALSAAADPAATTVTVHRGQFAGSGTCVASEGGKSLVVTKRHVIEGSTAAPWVDAAGQSYPGRLLTADATADLAAILVDGTLPVAELAEAEPPPGTPVRQWGRAWYGQGRPVYKEGRTLGLSGGRMADTGAGIYLTTISPESGDSGSGVFDADGKLVAVCWGGHAGQQHCVLLRDTLRFVRTAARDAFPRLAARLDKSRAKPAESPKSEPTEAAPAPQPAKESQPPKYQPGVRSARTKDCSCGAGCTCDPCRCVAPGQWRTDYATAVADASKAGKPVLIYFAMGAGCPACDKMTAGPLADPAVVEAAAGCVCVKIDVATPGGRRMGDEVGITSVPVLTVYRRAGERSTAELAGVGTAAEVLATIRAGTELPPAVLPRAAIRFAPPPCPTGR